MRYSAADIKEILLYLCTCQKIKYHVGKRDCFPRIVAVLLLKMRDGLASRM